MNTFKLKLSLNKGPLHTLDGGYAYGGVTLRQGDKLGTTIEADIYDGSTPYYESGLTVYFVMELPDHEHYYREQCTYSNAGKATVVVDESYAASVPGMTENAYFEFLKGSTVIASTQSFRVTVLKDARAGKTPGETYDSAIDEAIERANEAAEAAEEAAGGVTPLMSDSTRGGAKLGDGLSVDANEMLNVDPLTTTQIDDIVGDTSVTSPKVLNGTRLTYFFDKLKIKFAALVGGAVAVTQGGTGATTASAARTNLDAAQSDGATGTLKSAETGIGSLASSIASVESSTAAASHAQGSHFILGNVLRKATSAIAAGESITNSNSTTDTIQGQIDTLRDSVGNPLYWPIISIDESNDFNDIRAWIMKPKPNSANYPSGLGGNNAIVISFSPSSTTTWNGQIAFGFGADKIALRRRDNTDTWTSWKYFTAS